MRRIFFALVVAACGHRAQAPVVHNELGQSTVQPHPIAETAPDAAIVTSGAITVREVNRAPSAAAPTTIPPAATPAPTPAAPTPAAPAPDAQPGVASPPPVNP